MRVLAEFEEIKKALPMLDMPWPVQNDNNDNDTSFIYYCQRLDQVISLAISNKVNFAYVIHRWYNYQCSRWCEQFFCENGAEIIPFEKDHNADIKIEGVPFDIKLSIISDQYKGDKNLANRTAKNQYIEWLKANASKEQRAHSANKIYIIVDNLENKSHFLPICAKIISFIDYFKKNKEKYNGDEICELIYVPSEKGRKDEL